MSAKMILHWGTFCVPYRKVGKICTLSNVCKFTIYRHFTISVNFPDFQVVTQLFW